MPSDLHRDAAAQLEDLNRAGRRVQELIEKAGSDADPAMNAVFQECLESLLVFYGNGIARMMEIVENAGPEAARVYDSLLDDPIVRGLLLIHGLHPEPLAARLSAALEKIRPYMESHGGDVELISLENEVAKLRLRGHCQTCPSSSVTLELAIRSAIEEACPDLQGFEVEGVQPAAREPFEHAPAQAPEWKEISAPDLPERGSLANVREAGISIVLCNAGGTYFAYRDNCPACNTPLHLGLVSGDVIVCHLGHAFNLRRAGLSLENPALHLEPLPLLVQDGIVKVAFQREAHSYAGDR